MDHLSNQIGANIKHYRKTNNMSTTRLGELSGTSQSTISQIENGRSTSIENLIQICAALNVTLFDLLPADLLPNPQEEKPEKKQLLNLLNQMSDNEISTVQILLKTNILPVLKYITPFLKSLDRLDDEQKELLVNLFDSITNIK